MRFLITLLLSAGFLLTNTNGMAQSVPGALGYHEQALLFSNYNYSGSARIQGLGNTQISLGGDLSLALSNPAGLGFYNRSEVSITLGYNQVDRYATYIGNENPATSNNLSLNSIGAVFNRTKSDLAPGKYKGGSFAITFTKLNNFNSEIWYSGSNRNNDILDYYVQDANRQDVDYEFLEGVTYGAYDTYLLSDFEDVYDDGVNISEGYFYDRTFFGEFPTEDFPTFQEEIISSTGGQNQWSFSYGGNYDDFLYFGATLGLQTLRYNIIKEYREIYESNVVSNSSLVEDLLTEGFGVNGTFGVTARPIDQMTIGLSLITPTYLALDEYYYYEVEANYNNYNMNNYGDYFDDNYEFIENPQFRDTTSVYYPNSYTTFYESDDVLNTRSYGRDFTESIFKYSITTPMRINAGTSFFFSKHGFISADVEFVDYSTMKIKDDDGLLAGENNQVSSLYKSVVNLRAGGELRLKAFRLRAGYNYQPSPYQGDGIDRTAQTISAGLGFRSSKFYVDLTGSYKQFNSSYSPYMLENPDPENPDNNYLNTHQVYIENGISNVVLSFGLFF